MAYIMIVDDDQDFAETIALVIRNEGHEVQNKYDTESALQSMKNKAPDLVILDVMFPEDSSAGFELARTMRHENEKLKKVPILMLTAINAKFPLGFGPNDIDSEWMPVTDFLEKPVDFDILRHKVAKLLSKKSKTD
ncbi:MAG: response regulator [Sedimentisphaerales bacterium]|nr:response regulator [Sedimentisphaerales bacterium]